MPYPIRLDECTWTDIQSALHDGYDTVILPTASIEQHGPHLPLITDTLIGEALAAQIAARLGHAFAAPVVRPGLSSHHMAFPGSLTLSWPTFIHILEEYCSSLAEHGFRFIVIFSSHGGNFQAIHDAAASLQERLWDQGHTTRVIPYVDLDRYVRWQQEFLARRYGSQAVETSGHADLAETAMILSLRPDLVRFDRAQPGWMGNLSDVKEKLFKEGIHAITKNGILGDPRNASPEMGRALLDYLGEQMSEEIRAHILCRR